MNVDDVVDMSWSPTESITALLKGGGISKKPAKVVLVWGIVWDPTGRYVATAMTISSEMEKGSKKGFNLSAPTNPNHWVNIWTFNGKQLYVVETEFRLLQIRMCRN